MNRIRRIALLLLAAAAFLPADRAFLWIMQHSMCAFDPCKSMGWTDIGWIVALQAAILLVPSFLCSMQERPKPIIEDQP